MSREREECWRRLGHIGHKHTSQLERCMCNACRPTGMRRRAAAIVHNVSDNRTHERNCENIKWIKCTFLQTTFSCTGRMQFSCCCMCVWKNIDSLYVFNFQRIMLIHACVSILEKSVGVWERATEKSWPTDHPSLCNSLQCESGWLLQFLDAHPACGINFHFQKEGRESGREERQCTFKCTFPNLSLCIAADSYVESSHCNFNRVLRLKNIMRRRRGEADEWAVRPPSPPSLDKRVCGVCMWKCILQCIR